MRKHNMKIEIHEPLRNKPIAGDFIALDHDGNHPRDFNKGQQEISWYCSRVIAVEENSYRVEYDDGQRLYIFNKFTKPRLLETRNNNPVYVFPAVPN